MRHARVVVSHNAPDRPPIRLALVPAGADRHALVLVVHHILLDGWGIALLLREVFGRYDALAAGVPLPVSTADAVAVAAVIEAGYASAKQGSWVPTGVVT